jgi:hypothetical protein
MVTVASGGAGGAVDVVVVGDAVGWGAGVESSQVVWRCRVKNGQTGQPTRLRSQSRSIGGWDGGGVVS